MSIEFRFASAMYHKRIERGMTQMEAAEALDISLRWYESLENGHAVPSGSLVLKIIVYFQIELNLLTEDVYTSALSSC